MKPSNSTVAIVGIGVPLATIISWALNTFAGVEVPGPVEAAFGAVLAALVGYFFVGGKAVDTQDDPDSNDQAGFARPLMLAFMLAISLPAAFSLHGCATLGLAPASTFDQRLAYAVTQNAAVRQAAANALEAGEIQSSDATRVLQITDQVRTALDGAKLASGTGDVSTAEGRLQLATALLTELQKYLRKPS